jgi:competence protein ComEC
MKRPFLWLILFLTAGIISGQYAAVLPYTALLALVLCLYKGIKDRSIIFVLPFLVFIFGIMLRFATNQAPIFEADSQIFAKCTVRSVQFTKSGRQRIVAGCDEIYSEYGFEEADFKIMVYTPKGEFVDIGDEIAVKGIAADLKEPSVKGGFDMGRYVLSKGCGAAVYADEIFLLKQGKDSLVKNISAIRNKMHEVYYNVFPQNEAEIISAMVLGEGSLISDDVRELYSSSGIAHVLAVSGLHTAVICTAAIMLFKKLLGGRVAYIAAALFTVLYVLFVGAGASAVRAALMLEIVIIGRVLYREADTLNSLCAAAFIMLVHNPYIIYDIGFILSIGSVYGCIACGKIFEEEKAWHKRLLSMVAVSFMVSAFTLPVSAYSFYSVSFAGVFANIFVIPLLMPLIVMGMLCGILGIFSINAAVFMGGAVYIILRFFEFVSRAVSAIPFLNIHTGNLGLIFAVLYYILIIILINNSIKGFKKAALVFMNTVAIFVLLFGNRIFWHKNYIDFIDVGQGDCTVLRTYDGGVYVFDTGGYALGESSTGENILLPYLDYYGKDYVDALFVSHPDIDHCGGAAELMEGIEVGRLVMADYEYEESELYNSLMECAEKTGTKVEFIKAGYEAEAMGGCDFVCLYPLSENISEDKDDNRGSLVVKIICGKHSVLLTGDISAEDEKFLCFADAPLECDIFKTAHHGSRYSTTEEFVKRTKADTAIISYGKNNVYGHPAQAVRETLEEEGVKIYETALSGTISVVTDGKSMEIRTLYGED